MTKSADPIGLLLRVASFAAHKHRDDWAKQVVDQVRGTNAKLERRFDQVYRRRP